MLARGIDTKIGESIGESLRVHSRSEISTGAPISIGERVLIPVIGISANLVAGGRLGWAEMSPKAVVVVESDGEHVLSLTEGDHTLGILLAELPSLASEIEEAREDLNV